MSKDARQTWERIVDGALVALARHGQYKFSMTDVCAESGVSRGTLYRYFASKEELLAAVEERLEASLRERIIAAIAAQPEPSKRLRVVTAAVAQHREQFPAADMLMRTEPGLVLARLGDRFDDLAALFQECLHPALVQARPVKRGYVTEDQVARILLHCGISYAALPRSTGERAENLASIFEGLLGLGAAAGTGRSRKAG